MRSEPDKRRNPVKVRLKPEKTGDYASGRFDLGADRWLSHHVANHC
jgi:hypothetical protein